MKIIIFDTETIGKVNQDLINVGWKVIDLNVQQATYKTIVERDYIITSLINNKVYCLNDDFVGQEKYDKFIKALESGKAIKRNLKQVFKTLKNDIKKHNVLFAYAYNCKFDIDKFERNDFEMPIPVFDIWGYAYDKIIATENYKKWCIDNEMFTASGRYIKGSVEGVVAYLTDNKEFIEDHTALSDVQWETAILVECVKRGSDITRESVTPRNIKSDKVFSKLVILPNKQYIEIDYKSMYEKDGVITYKW